MALHKIKDFYPDYRDHFGDHDILGYSFYDGNDKVGSVDDILVDDEGRFRYLVINTGAWIFGKKVLLPIGQARIEYGDRRIYSDGLSRQQVEELPEYDPNATLDYDYEERVRGVYRPNAASTGLGATAGIGTARDPNLADSTAELDRSTYDRSLESNRPLDASRPLDTGAQSPVQAYNRNFDRNTYRYDYDPGLYNLNDRDHQTLRLYEERLIAGKSRQKTGEVAVGKRVETETQHVSVPVEKERVVIERVNPTDTTVGTGENAFQEGEVARVEVYEETPEIRKEAFVREEVRVRKEVDRDTVESEETIRKERLNIDKNGNPIVNE